MDTQANNIDMTIHKLTNMTIINLKQLCRDKDFKGFSTYKTKKTLVQFLYERIQRETEIINVDTKMFFENIININIQTDTDIDEDTQKNIIQQLNQQSTEGGIPITDIITNKDHIIDTNDKNKLCGYIHNQPLYRTYWVFNNENYNFIIKVYKL